MSYSATSTEASSGVLATPLSMIATRGRNGCSSAGATAADKAAITALKSFNNPTPRPNQ